MTIAYRIAEEIQSTVDRIIEDFHPHLRTARVCWLFKEYDRDAKIPDLKIGKKWTLAKMSKCGPLDKSIHGYDFKCWIDERFFDSSTLEQHEALIDHELCHCGWDAEKGEFYVRDHDIEEFIAILERRGLWLDDRKEFAEACQMSLFDDGGRPKAKPRKAARVRDIDSMAMVGRSVTVTREDAADYAARIAGRK